VKPILVHTEARSELDEAISYYEQRQQGLGLDLQSEVEQTISQIQQLPEAIWIAAIAHGKLRPDYWKRRKVEGGE